jgi:hypothetical protein
VYTLIVSNANWTSQLVVTYTPDGAAPNSTCQLGIGNVVTYNATDVVNALSIALQTVLGTPGCKTKP